MTRRSFSTGGTKRGRISSPAAALLRLSLPQTKFLLGGIFFGAVASGAAVALLTTSSWLIAKAAEQIPIMYLGVAIVGVRFFALARAFFRYIERLVSHDGAFRALGELRIGVYRKAVPLAPGGLQQLRRGELLSKTVSDVDTLQDYPLRVVQPLIVSLLVLGGSIGFIAFYSVFAALALLIVLLLCGVLSYLLNSRFASQVAQTLSPLKARLAGQLHELVQRIDVLSAFGLFESRAEQIRQTDAELQRAETRSAVTASLVQALVSFFSGMAVLLMVLLAHQGLNNNLSGPEFAMLVLAPLAIFEVFATVPQVFGVWDTVRSSAEQLATALPEVPELPDSAAWQQTGTSSALNSSERGAQTLPALQDKTTSGVLVELSDLTVLRPGQREPVLQNVSLTLPAGSVTLLQGSSGSGKTSLAHALVRFLPVTGNYVINGYDVTDYSPEQLRMTVGLLEQRPFLFHNTLRNNLNFAAPQASDEELFLALDRVGLGDWVVQRGGLEVELGQGGALVSGGQAHRISLARALLANFGLLILDEPTAHVQPDLAQQLLHDMVAAARQAGQTVLLISHDRPEGIELDQLLQVTDGTVRTVSAG